MKYSIKKKDVIKAIATEPWLGRGAFFLRHDPSNGKTYRMHRDTGDCAVCAVGAVLRAISSGNFTEDDACKAAGDFAAAPELDKAHKANNFLAILSSEYETAAWESDDKSWLKDSSLARFHAINVAEALCPDVLEFEV